MSTITEKDDSEPEEFLCKHYVEPKVSLNKTIKTQSFIQLMKIILLRKQT